MGKSKISKSATIRAELKANPGKSATDIAKEIGVSPTLVYNVKANLKKKAGKTAGAVKRKPGRKPGRKPHAKTVAPHSAHAALDSAFEFVTKVGGLLHAEQLIERLKSIKERL
ncbi:MAG TPA: hypothetical protein VHY20_02250, partial [Pirellulales bacterium]|nr:hypothetical protein [Pirellulales bacterium]